MKIHAVSIQTNAPPSRRRVRFFLPVGFALLPVVVMLLAGCNSSPIMRGNGTPPARVSSTVPTAGDLVAYLNDNARRMQTMECQDLLLDARQRLQEVGLKGQMVCQKPRNFRLAANAAGQPQVDLGSNAQEFWYWIGKADPHLFHCSYQDFAQSRVRLPFPFQPEWVMEALGMAEYDPSKNYQVVPEANTLKLVEQTTSPQGQPVRKITLFNRASNQVQVTGHILQDATGKDICRASIQEVLQDRTSGAIFPHRVQLEWPSEHITLKMRLESVTINGQFDERRVARLFSRPNYPSIRSYDLARGQVDSPGQGVSQAGAP